jgi:hypothetical protein
MRPRLTYANVVATLALFIALGGASYAAFKLPKNSVGNRQLKKNSVTGAKVKDDSLTGADIAGGLPKQTVAGGTGTTGTAGGDLSPPYTSPANFTSVGLPDALGGCPGAIGWADLSPDINQSVGYYRGPEGLVYLEGSTIRCEGSTATIFNLPPGYRPERRRYFAAPRLESPTATHMVEVLESNADTKDPRAAGDVVGVLETNTQISLDGIVFRCGPSGVNGCP